MRDVTDFGAFTEPDAVGESVLNDPEMIAVIGDFCGKIDAVPPAQDALLARPGRPPVNFELQLVRLDETRGLRQPLAQLRQKEHESMRASPEVPQVDRLSLSPPALNGAIRERRRGGRIPLLSPEDMRSHSQDNKGERARHHAFAISRWVVAAASAGALSLACRDALLPAGDAVGTEELIFLALQPDAPPVEAVTFYASNVHLTVRTLRHTDAVNSAFVEVRFPPGSLVSLDGQPLLDTDSVLVTIEPRPGVYGIRISPAGLAFTLSNTPEASFFLARYADLSVADGSARYPTRNDYAAALDVWQEIDLDLWRVAKGSSPTPSSAAAGLDEPGEYGVAARR